jgi:hypothetical protein
MDSVMRRELEMAREFAVKTLAVRTKNMAMAAAFKSHPSAKNAEGWGSRLFWWAAMLLLVILPSALWAQGPALTTVNGNIYLADLVNAEVTNVTSTTVTMDAGITPGAGGGIEVRYSDAGWGPDNNRNLVGRFTSSTFTLTRYARAQDYFLRSYDGSVPAKYSRYSTGLHVDYPL